MRSDSLREKPKQTARIIAGILAVLVAAAIFVMSSIPASGYPSHPDSLNVVAHFGAYFVLASLLAIALNAPKRKLWIAALMAIIIASLYGASDEIHQYFVPTRNCDPIDWVVDTLGAFFGAAITVWMISARTVKRSRSRDRVL